MIRRSIYPRCRFDGNSFLVAHRMAWLFQRGKPPHRRSMIRGLDPSEFQIPLTFWVERSTGLTTIEAGQ